MLTFKLLQTEKGFLLDGNKKKSYIKPVNNTYGLFHDLVAHSYDPLANGWEDELIAFGRRLFIDYSSKKIIDTNHYLIDPIKWIRANINDLLKNKVNIRSCPYLFSNKEHTRLRFYICKGIKSFIKEASLEYPYLSFLPVELYYHIRNWMIYGVISFANNYPEFNYNIVYKRLAALLETQYKVNSKILVQLDLNKNQVTWEIK